MEHKFGQGVKSSLSAHLTCVFFQIAGLAISVRLISKSDFGTFVLLSVMAQFLCMVADFGLTSSTVHFLAARKDDRKDIASTSLGLSIIIALIIFIFTYFCGHKFLFTPELKRLKELMFFIAALFFFQYLLYRLNSLLQGIHLYNRFAFVQVVGAITKFIFILVFLVAFQMQLIGLVIATVASIMVSSLLAYMLIPWYIIPNLNSLVLRRLLAFGLPLQINNFLGFIFDRSDTIMLGVIIGPVAVGIFEPGYKLMNNLRAFFESFRVILFPHLSKYYGNNKHNDAEYVLRNALRIISLIVAGVTPLALLYGIEIISFSFSV